ncbi:hypothetical protein ERICIV_02203 [Paenibacillus larvae subsp. larvae]|uniref:Exonuclease n=6 Tax=root TaxID=1 RepID=A0A345AVJ5_9CAUD|nr:hypothetical protein [Paenibacillus larvae]YP_010082318.1 CRISPR/Cas system associated [Paenibacillus phage Halcyone]YP_010082409.1 CRISPR/Cas system associated [Paenibacillus phage Scottie]YP_010082487.1 CRISPR/Cas system associated [Paenibacillus phage Unity]AXF41018.1 hypothetical protein HEATH_64 [Paenibacillus phage Heath]MED2910128.1 hypothetical protein [Bacillus thuringiensis]AVF26343.1 hypothetical protein ERICIII_02182 [Paenibacillus larvae subsp. larvae]AVF31120.1 hypothetical 
MDDWHSRPEVFDDKLDAQLHEWYADYIRNKKVWPPRDIPYFSPSSANSDPRELYVKLNGAKRDIVQKPPYQGRWTRIGTAIGDTIQRDLLLAERHVSNPIFRFKKNEDGTPMFEEFAKKARNIMHKGKVFALYGTCDGIMLYTSDDGDVIRVGLEIKSKQTTYSQTSLYSMREPKEDHVKQTVCYSIMYDVDYYIILYVNASKKGWNISEEDYAKSPDIRAFGIHITDDMRNEVIDTFASVLKSVEKRTPPALDIEKWTFNNYKRACALSLSDEEVDDIKRKSDRMLRSSLPDWKKLVYRECVEFIESVRSEVTEADEKENAS